MTERGKKNGHGERSRDDPSEPDLRDVGIIIKSDDEGAGK